MTQAEDTPDNIIIPTFCHKCQQDIYISLPKIIIDNANSYPVSHAHLHGNPPHVLVVYVDRQYLIRGTELSDTVTVERARKTTPLSAMVLLQVPPRYKQTAMAMLKLRQANSAEIAVITGKTQNAESKYLGAMFRLGYLERIRIKRFFQYTIPGKSR